MRARLMLAAMNQCCRCVNWPAAPAPPRPVGDEVTTRAQPRRQHSAPPTDPQGLPQVRLAHRPGRAGHAPPTACPATAPRRARAVAILRCKARATFPQRACTRLAYLYRIDLALPVRPMTLAKEAALDKAMAARQVRTVTRIRRARPATWPPFLLSLVPPPGGARAVV